MHALGRLFHSSATPLLIASIAVLVLGALLVPVVITRLPADYFVRSGQKPQSRSGVARVVVFWLRNLAGALLIAAGLLMLVLPGQGVLTILAGLSLLDFPGKRKLQLQLLRVPAIAHAIDRMRRRAGKPPLRLDDTAAAH